LPRRSCCGTWPSCAESRAVDRAVDPRLKTDSDPRVGETGLATIDVDYSVKPCQSKQVVTVESRLTEYADPSAVLWDDPAAPTSGRFTVAGVKLRTTYAVTVIVRDATTGATVGSATQLTAAVPKGV
jgi:hypothetical protein